MSHSSRLEQLTNSPFLVHWCQGRVQSIYVPNQESLSLVNLKKGIASLFQFQLLDLETNETDSSGHCTISYTSTGPNSFKKTKKTCQASEDTPYLIHPDDLFSVSLVSIRDAFYQMADDMSYINKLETKESHEMTVNIRQEAGNKVNIEQELKFIGVSRVDPITSENLDDVVQQISSQLNIRFSHETLTTEREPRLCQDAECPTFATLVAENLINIQSENFGKIKGATGFLKVLNAARDARKDEIYKVLNTKKYKKIL